jgi:hypothetical protein
MHSRNQILGAPAKAERILMNLANVPDWPPIGELPQFEQHVAWVERMRKLYPGAYRHCSTIDVIVLRELLRKAWASPDPQRREWFVFLLRHFHAGIVRRAQALQEKPDNVVRDWQDKNALLDHILAKPENAARALHALMDNEQAITALKDDLPVPSEFDAAAFHLQRNLNRALHCLNPTCARPYFFLTSKNQKYCSDACSNYGRRESKRRWWNENRAKPKSKKRR